MENRQRWIVTCATVFVLCTAFQIVSAQNESGKRPINRTKFETMGYWYNSSTAMFQAAYPIIRSLPPLNSGMPWDIQEAYTYMDSIAKFDVEQRTINMLERETSLTNNDMLKGVVKYLYTVTDFNPIIFRQYRDEVDLHRWDKYKTGLNTITEQVKGAFLRLAPDRSERLALYSILFPDYILRVRVAEVDSMELKSGPNPVTTHRFRVKCDILDTLKGRVISTCTDQLLIKENPRAVVYYKPPCLEFQFTRNHYWGSGSIHQSSYLYQTKDPAFSMGPDSVFTMHPGQEAIVFLTHRASVVDSSFDYYNLDLEPQASYNALPIIDGQVRDVNRIWSSSEMMSLEDWKIRFFQLREKILTMR